MSVFLGRLLKGKQNWV